MNEFEKWETELNRHREFLINKVQKHVEEAHKHLPPSALIAAALEIAIMTAVNKTGMDLIDVDKVFLKEEEVFETFVEIVTTALNMGYCLALYDKSKNWDKSTIRYQNNPNLFYSIVNGKKVTAIDITKEQFEKITETLKSMGLPVEIPIDEGIPSINETIFGKPISYTKIPPQLEKEIEEILKKKKRGNDVT